MRLFSVPRRRTNLIDLYTPFVYGVELYRIKWATNFDQVFTTIIEAPNTGFLDPAVPPNVIEPQPTSGRQVRIVFDPATYSITDGAPIWLQVAHVTGVVESDLTPPTLILTEAEHHGVGVITIAGTAPLGADVTASLQLDLPRLMSDIRFINAEASGGANLYVATQPGGAETVVPPTVDAGQVLLTLNGTESSLLVRGGGGTAAFSASMTLAFPR